MLTAFLYFIDFPKSLSECSLVSQQRNYEHIHQEETSRNCKELRGHEMIRCKSQWAWGTGGNAECYSPLCAVLNQNCSNITDQTTLWSWTLPISGLCAQNLFLKISQFYHSALHSSAHHTLMTFIQKSSVTFIVYAHLCWSGVSLPPLIHIRERNAPACWGYIFGRLTQSHSRCFWRWNNPFVLYSTAERHGEAAHCRAQLTWQSYRLHRTLCCAIQLQ